ncbi:hypothetical protein [Acrocarpospora sp. B8E8]|uniref:hypothetical protein n=1 Tax=Acrocarpospora sp. B8E8 TaxID=3153572 RepID=UPI00325EB227
MFPLVSGLLSDLSSGPVITGKIADVIVITRPNAGYFPFIPVDYGPGADLVLTPGRLFDHAAPSWPRRRAAACA